VAAVAIDFGATDRHPPLLADMKKNTNGKKLSLATQTVAALAPRTLETVRGGDDVRATASRTTG
jgi:hypothetical protein